MVCAKKGATFTQTRFAVSEDMDWLKSLRGRSGKPNNQWSEEDERDVAEYIYETCDGFTEYSAREVARDILSILQSNHHWKPSDEQVEALDKAIPVCMGVVGKEEIEPLESLYDDLKKR